MLHQLCAPVNNGLSSIITYHPSLIAHHLRYAMHTLIQVLPFREVHLGGFRGRMPDIDSQINSRTLPWTDGLAQLCNA